MNYPLTDTAANSHSRRSSEGNKWQMCACSLPAPETEVALAEATHRF